MTSSQECRGRTTLRLSPFRGVRYAPGAGDLGDLTFTPPTAWSTVPADLLSRLHPHHVLRLLAPAFGADPAVGARRARATLTRWLADGVMRRDPEPALYVYEQSATGATVRGVIAAVDLTPGTPALLDHEEVIGGLVDTQETLERTLRAQIEPILALHRGAAALREVLDEVTSTAPDAVTGHAAAPHRLWRVSEPTTIDRIAHAVPDEPVLIADGHHRHAAWQRSADRALALLTDVDQPGIRLGAIHRVISNIAPRQVIASPAVHAHPLSGRDEAIGYLASGRDCRCVIYADGTYYATTPADRSASCAAPDLAVCHLHSHWLTRWDVTEDDVGYVHDIDEAIALAEPGRVAILFPDPRIDIVVEAARARRPLPRKATSFRPKPLVGTVLRVRPSS